MNIFKTFAVKIISACLFPKFCACEIFVLVFALVVAQYRFLTHDSKYQMIRLVFFESLS